MGSGEDEYRAHYAQIDPRARFAAANPQTRIHYDHMLIDERGMDRDAFYDFQSRSTDDFRYFLGCRVQVDADHAGYIALHWPRRMGHVRPAQIRRFERLVPHIERALQIGDRVAAAERNGAIGDAAIDRVPHAIFVFDAAGRALRLNHAAEALIRRGDGLSLSSGRLAATRPDDDAALRRLIAAAAAGTPAADGAHAVARPSGRRPYMVLVAPMPIATPMPGWAAPAAIAVVTDPEQCVELPIALLIRLYGLTRAEAAIAERMGGGKTVKQAAGELRIATNTARRPAWRRTSTA